MIYYLIFINTLGFILMGVDKRRAISHKYRISEKRLFQTAVIGGSLGCWIGMYFFRHKTKHWYFVCGIPVIFILQIILGYFIIINN